MSCETSSIELQCCDAVHPKCQKALKTPLKEAMPLEYKIKYTDNVTRRYCDLILRTDGRL